MQTEQAINSGKPHVFNPPEALNKFLGLNPAGLRSSGLKVLRLKARSLGCKGECRIKNHVFIPRKISLKKYRIDYITSWQ